MRRKTRSPTDRANLSLSGVPAPTSSDRRRDKGDLSLAIPPTESLPASRNALPLQLILFTLACRRTRRRTLLCRRADRRRLGGLVDWRNLGLMSFLLALIHAPCHGMIRRLVDDDGNVSNQSLFEHTSQELNVKHALIATDLRVFKDVERVGPVACASTNVGDRVGHVRPQFVDANIEIIGNEELTRVCHLSRDERAVGKRLPLRVNFGVNVGCSSGVVTWKNGREFSDAVRVGRLSSTQPRLFIVVLCARKGAEETFAMTGSLRLFVLEVWGRVRVAGVVAGGVAVLPGIVVR